MKPLSKSMLTSLETAVQQYELVMQDDGPANQYLQERGIGLESIAEFRLGFVADPISGHESYRGRIAIPGLDHRNRPYSLRFRALPPDETGPKYLGLPDAQTRLFNIRAVHADSEFICITEGEFDAIILNQCGIPAVGVTGADSWKKHHPRIFAGFRNVYVLGDGDSAGQKFAKTVTTSLTNATAVPLPTGEDVNSLYLATGKQHLISLLPIPL